VIRQPGLTQKADVFGCVSETGTGGTCQDGTLLTNAQDLVVSPDGENLYVAGWQGLAILNRDPSSGVLAQPSSPAGCVSETGTSGACQIGRALNLPFGVAVTPYGKSVLVADLGDNALAVFDRSLSTGALTQKLGTAGCVVRPLRRRESPLTARRPYRWPTAPGDGRGRLTATLANT
jgi:DNA-binding beta-propeller fold protein YncE